MFCRHYHNDTENTILSSPPIQFGRQSHDNTRIIFLSHVDLDFHLHIIFFIQKGPTGGTIYRRLLSLCSQIVTVLRSKRYSIFWKMIDFLNFSLICNNYVL